MIGQLSIMEIGDVHAAMMDSSSLLKRRFVFLVHKPMQFSAQTPSLLNVKRVISFHETNQNVLKSLIIVST